MLRPWLLSFILLLAPGHPTAAAAEPLAPPDFHPGQIWDVTAGRPIGFDDLAARLAALDVVYLGEEHHNKWHVEAALKVLAALQARQRRPTLAMEMFGWEAQPALDRYLTDRSLSREEFLTDVQWEQNWGGAFADYEPLVEAARRNGWPLLALNPPRQLVRLVAKQGLAAGLDDPAMRRWGMQEESFPEDPAYRDMITAPLRQCHGGLPEQAYGRMYEASMFRDEGMARTIAAALRREAGPPGDGSGRAGPVVSYTGGGHVQYHLPVPKRVQRRHEAVAQASIYLTAFEPTRQEDLRRLLAERVADYLWLTPLSDHGAPKRC